MTNGVVSKCWDVKKNIFLIILKYRRIYHDQFYDVLKKNQIQSTNIHRGCIKLGMHVQETREECKSRIKRRASLSAYPSQG